MRLDPVQRVGRPSQPLKKKRASRRKSASHHVLRVLTIPGLPLCSTWLCRNSLQVCAIIRPFSSSKTICEFREILSTVPTFHGPFFYGRVVLCQKPKEIL